MREAGALVDPSFHEDGSTGQTMGIICSLPPELGVQSTPGPRQDGCFVLTVGVFPPEQVMLIAPGPREDGRIVEIVVSTRH